ncbi:GAF domain-containing protein [Leptolyngbya sp. FACHB-36]|uniref:sensor histidine kinase n=1 Tax=Leptolyngbya sp. FACHB-36 TaxID=2692808 RepID=UPI0016805460|nr:ATP-binding protein [Leptolyngbya sp. FACHB-36]MBD2021092.1 GAF domain-containing protein [Leptolyngbya sp. FACHB-36]
MHLQGLFARSGLLEGTIGGFRFVLILLVSIGSISYASFLQLGKLNQRVTNIYPVLATDQRLIAQITDAETAQRDYPLTARQYLSSYQSAVERTVELAHSQPHRMSVMSSEKTHLVELQHSIDSIDLQPAKFALVRRVVQTEQEQPGMDSIHRLSQNVELEENQRLRKQLQQEQTHAQTLTLLTVLSSSIAAALILASSVLIWREIDKRKQAEAALQSRAHQQAAVAELGEQALTGLSLPLLHEAVVRVADSLDVEYANVLELLPEGDALLLRAGVGWQQGTVGQATIDGADSPAGYALQCSSPVVVNDLSSETRFTKPPLLVKHGVISVISVVIAGETQPFGVLGAYTTRQRVFTRDDVHFLQSVAAVISGAIARQQSETARQRQAEQEQLVIELERLNQLKDDFLSTVSHELRTPITNMRMALQMLKLAPLPEKFQRYREILEAECIREADLISDLLDLQRLETESQASVLVTAIDLTEWIPHIVEPFQVRTQERQQLLQIDVSSDLPYLMVNHSSLERVLVELLNNACKYTPAKGTVSLKVEAATKVAEAGSKAVAAIVFTIRNQAEIPASELPRIFEKFYRVPNADPWKQGGTGLGLALVQKLVEQIGGTIDVNSSQSWTTFTVQISR